MRIKLTACSGQHPAATAAAPPALQSIHLSIAAGEQVAVIGPSGAGKTTLLQLLACALKPSAGSLHLGEYDPWALPTAALQDLRGKLFLAPQVPPLPPRQRVVTAVLAGRLPQMRLAQSLASLFYPKSAVLAQTALAQFDLAEKLFDRVDRLSGGERQRVGLARALAALEGVGAKLLLVDEPLSALDPERARQALLALTHAARQQGATLVATLHHVEMALRHFPRIVGLRAGEIAFDLPAAAVSPEILHDLYASHMDELTGPAPVADFALISTPAVAMQCR
jgi:phosphonate transport system ATP-binding protein